MKQRYDRTDSCKLLRDEEICEWNLEHDNNVIIWWFKLAKINAYNFSTKKEKERWIKLERKYVCYL